MDLEKMKMFCKSPLNSAVLQVIVSVLGLIVFLNNCPSVFAEQPQTVDDLNVANFNSQYRVANCNAKDLFIFGVYSPRTSRASDRNFGVSLSDIAKDNFTIAGPFYPHGPEWLEGWLNSEAAECLAYDICLAYPIVPRRTVRDKNSPKYHGPVGSPVRVANLNHYGDDEVADADDEQIKVWVTDVEHQIRGAISDPTKNSVIAMWYILPEEMRYWKKRELELLQSMHNAVKKHDPLQRPTMMYEPQHSAAKRLMKTVPYQDILTVGIYPHHAGNDRKRIHVRHTMSQIVQAIKVTGSDAFPMPTLEMFEGVDYPYDAINVPLIPKFIRHDAYCAFANGAKGIFVWSMGSRRGFRTYNYYYDSWAKLSKEVSKLGLHKVFLQGKLLRQATVSITSGETNIRFQWNKIDQIYPTISIRDWSYNQKRYILIVNSSQGAVNFTLHGIKEGTYRNLFNNITYIIRGPISLSLPAYGVMVLMS